jgi:hypothetical protein
MKSPDKIGQITEGVILSEFLKYGLTVLTPFGYSHRYDFVVDSGEKFYRIQCKTGRIRNGAVEFNTCSMNSVTHERKFYHGQRKKITLAEDFLLEKTLRGVVL